MANLEVFFCHGVEYAIIRFDDCLAPWQRRIPCIVTELIHYLGKLLNFLLMCGKVRILATYLLSDVRTDFIHALAHAFHTLFTPDGRHYQLGKPGILARGHLLTKLGKNIKLLWTAATGWTRRR